MCVHKYILITCIHINIKSMATCLKLFKEQNSSIRSASSFGIIKEVIWHTVLCLDLKWEQKLSKLKTDQVLHFIYMHIHTHRVINTTIFQECTIQTNDVHILQKYYIVLCLLFILINKCGYGSLLVLQTIRLELPPVFQVSHTHIDFKDILHFHISLL